MATNASCHPFAARLRACAAAAVFAVVSCGAAHAEEHDLQSWLTGVAKIELSKKWDTVFEATWRFGDDLSRLQTTQVKGSLLYSLADNISIGGGYGYIVSKRPGNDIEENRIWEELNWKPGKIGGVSVALRTRLEERFVETGSETGWRFRQQIKLTRPIHDGASNYVFGSGEILIGLNHTDWNARYGFDQSRLSAGMGFKLSDTLKLEAGYLNQFQPRRAAEDRMAHALAVTVKFEP
ncbi:MAG: DUF2490 domain-containing protein [Parvularculaceae bacterium]